MRPSGKEPRNFKPIASGCVLGLAAILALGACGLETFVAPEEAMEAPPAAVDGNRTAEAVEGTSGVIWMRGTACGAGPAALPLIILDGVRSEAGFREIVALGIESFEIVKGSDAVEIYGEDGRNGAIVIFTKQSSGDGNDDETPAGRPTG